MADPNLLDHVCYTVNISDYYRNRQGCLKGIRKEVLLQLEDWLMNKHDWHIFWLNGPIGVGEFIITQMFIEMNFVDRRASAGF